MHYRLYQLNETFDYLSEALPDALFFSLGDQLERARAILANRSHHELEYGFDALDWLLREGGKRFEAELVAGVHGEEAFDSRMKALKAFQPHFDLIGQADFPGARWSEFYALLALANVGEQLFEYSDPDPAMREYLEREAPGAHAQTRSKHVADAALEAMEAVCTAECLQHVDRLGTAEGESQWTALARKTGQKGGRAHAAKFNELRRTLLAHYDNHFASRKNLSNRKAAKLLCNEFSDEIERTLNNEEPEHLIAKWIGQHLKNQSRHTERS